MQMHLLVVPGTKKYPTNLYSSGMEKKDGKNLFRNYAAGFLIVVASFMVLLFDFVRWQQHSPDRISPPGYALCIRCETALLLCGLIFLMATTLC